MKLKRSPRVTWQISYSCLRCLHSFCDFRSLPAVNSSKNVSENKRKKKSEFVPKRRRNVNESKNWNAKRPRKNVKGKKSESARD